MSVKHSTALQHEFGNPVSFMIIFSINMTIQITTSPLKRLLTYLRLTITEKIFKAVFFFYCNEDNLIELIWSKVARFICMQLH